MKKLRSILYRLRGEVSTEDLIKIGLKVGKNFRRNEHCIIDQSHCWLITIGDNVTLAPNVHILAHDASMWADTGYTRIAPVNIGNNVFIGGRQYNFARSFYWKQCGYRCRKCGNKRH